MSCVSPSYDTGRIHNFHKQGYYITCADAIRTRSANATSARKTNIGCPTRENDEKFAYTETLP